MLMAPVVRNRKGEHLQLFDELRAQGFVRARIDGVVCDLDDAPALELRRKHTIEVVIDRIKVREDLKQRLAESFETAIVLADGLAIVAPMDDDSGLDEKLFSHSRSPFPLENLRVVDYIIVQYNYSSNRLCIHGSGR